VSIKALAGLLGVSAGDFIAGWIEGRTRYQLAPHKDVIAGSTLPPRSVGRAASQAAVAYYEALDEREPAHG
jgi:hypothetical protein